MISYSQAAEKAKTADGNPVIHTAWDFGKFYLFSTAPKGVSKTDRYETGTIFTAVDKASGRVYDYDITEDVNAYLNATVLTV